MAQEHRRSPHEPERRGRSAPRTRSTQSRPAPARRRNGGASFALLYVIFVIGISALLACIGWVAANDVLALNKPEKTATITIREEDSFGDVVSMLEENGLIEYQSLFKLFAAFTGGRDKIVAGTFTLNTDMDYRALISGMSANSATKATVKVTIPEGYSIDQIFALLEEKGVVSDTAKLEEEAANHDYAFSFLQDLPWATTTGWRAICTRTPMNSPPPRIPCTSSTRCWSGLTPNSPRNCASRSPTAGAPSTRCSPWPPSLRRRPTALTGQTSPRSSTTG